MVSLHDSFQRVQICFDRKIVIGHESTLPVTSEAGDRDGPVEPSLMIEADQALAGIHNRFAVTHDRRCSVVLMPFTVDIERLLTKAAGIGEGVFCPVCGRNPLQNDNADPGPGRQRLFFAQLDAMISGKAKLLRCALQEYSVSGIDGAILQESYKLSPPSSEEVAATLRSTSIYKWLVASYGVH